VSFSISLTAVSIVLVIESTFDPEIGPVFRFLFPYELYLIEHHFSWYLDRIKVDSISDILYFYDMRLLQPLNVAVSDLQIYT
jgi:hypothetical protein